MYQQRKEQSLLIKLNNNNQGNMKKILIISLSMIVLSCSNVKVVYNNEKPYLGDQPNQPSLKTINATESSKTIIVLTTGFKKDTVVMKNINKVLFNDEIVTSGTIGLADYIVVNNNDDVVIEITTINIKLRLKNEYMKRYKYVYISKKEKVIKIEYSNSQKTFA